MIVRPHACTLARNVARTSVLLVIIALLFLVGPRYADAATGTIVPNADKASSGFTNGLGCTSPWFNCIDEVLPGSPNDSDYLQVYNGDTSSYELTTFTSASASSMKLWVRGDFNCTVNYSVKLAAGTVVVSGSTAAGGVQTVSASASGLSLNQTDINGLYLEFTSSGFCSPSRILAASVDIDTATISGNAGDASICDGVTPVIGIAVNSTKWGNVPCTPVTGAYIATTTWAAGNVITVFYDGVTPDAVDYIRPPSSSAVPIAGITLFDGRTRLASFSGTQITNTDVNLYDFDNDPDIPSRVTAGALVTTGIGIELVVGGFTPGGAVTSPIVWIHASTTWTAGANALAITGSGNGSCDNLTAGTPLCVAGTFTAGTGTVTYSGTSSTVIGAIPYSNLAVTSASPTTFELAAGTVSTTGTLTVSGSATLSTTAQSPTVTVAGAATVNAGATFGGSGSGTVTIAGNFTGAGTVNFTGGTVELRSGAAQTLNPTGSAWQFATLLASGTATRTLTLTNGSQQVRASLLQIGKTGDTGVVTFAGGAAGNTIVTSGNLVTTVGRGTFQPAATTTVSGDVVNAGTITGGTAVLVVHGNFTSTGTFTSGTSTVRFAGAGTTSTITGTLSFASMDMIGAGKVLQLANNITITTMFMPVGGSCANTQYLRSTTAGVARTITTSGAVFQPAYARIQDISTTTGTSAFHSVNLGNTSNITFFSGACDLLVPNADKAASGAPTAVGSAPCASGARWECINETVYTPTDTDYVLAGSNPTVQSYELTTMTLPTTATGVRIDVRARSASACSMTFSVRKADATVLATNTVALAASAGNHNASATGLSLSQSDVDGLYAEVTLTGAGCAVTAQVLALDVDVTPSSTTVTGTADNTAICDGITPVIGIAVNTAKYATIPCTIGTGDFSSDPIFAATDTVTVYYDGVGGGATNAGATWAKAAGAGVTGITLGRRAYRTEARSAGTPITTTDIAKWDNGDDADIQATSAGTFSVTDAGARLEVGTNSFQPSIAVAVPGVWVRSGATYDAQATALTVSNTGTGTCTNSVANIPLCTAGTFSAGTGTVTFTGTGATAVGGGTYNNLVLNGSASSDFQLGNLGGSSSISMNAFTLSASAGSPTTTTTANVSTVSVAGVSTINANTTLQGSAATDWTIAGNFQGNGTVNLTGGSVDLRSAQSGGFQYVFSGAQSWTFATLTVSSAPGGTRTVSGNSGSPVVNVLQNLTIGKAGDSLGTNMYAWVMSGGFNVTGDVNVLTSSTFSTTALNVGGNLTNAGTLNQSNTGGPISFTGTGTSTYTNTGSATLYKVRNVTGGKTLALASPVVIGASPGAELTITGSSCNSLARLTSSLPGTQRSVNVGNTYFSAANAAFQDIGSVSAITATSAENLGNNANITYGTPPCGAVRGIADNVAICDNVTPVIGIAINTTKFGTVPCAAGTGAFNAGATFAIGDTVTAYYDGVAAGAVNRGATWAKAATASTTPLTGIVLTRQQYRTEARAAGTPITTADVAKWDSNDDADILATSTATFDVTDPGGFLEIGTNTFRPSVTVRVPQTWIRAGATYDAQATLLQISNPGNSTCSDVDYYIPFCVAGTFLPGTGTVRFTSASTVHIAGGTYNNIELVGSASSNFVLGNLGGSSTIDAASLTLSSSAGSPVATTSSQVTTINISGPVTVNANTTLQGSAATNWSIGGNLSGDGDINFTGGTVELRSAGTASQLNASGTLPGTPWQFATLIASTAAGARTVTVPATSRELRVGTALQLGRGADGSIATLDASALTRPITVTGNLNLTNRGSFTMPPITELHGNLQQDGWTTPGTGVLRVRGSGTSILQGSGGGGVYDLAIDVPSKTVQIGSDFQYSHTMTLDGGSCTTPVRVRSTVNGVRRTIYNPGVTLNSQYASIRDIGLSVPTTVTATGNISNNANITFGDNAVCAAPTLLHTGTTSAAAGAVNATNINGAAAFRTSFRNNIGTTADRFKTEVSTSPLDSSVLGLWPLDGNAADRSANANTGSLPGSPTFSAGATNFGQAANFDGVDDEVQIPNLPAYDVTTFTVELWMKASSLGSASYPLLATRSAGSTNSQFQIYTQASDGNLVASLSAGGVFYGTNTPIAPWLDNSWHHIAMTADASKDLRLYVDGIQYGPTIRYTGTIDLPNAPIRIGGSYAGNRFLGSLDDVQFSSSAKTTAELAGYASTRRPHAQSIWQSANFNTSGDYLSSTCTTATRCVDTTYGGPNIHRDGARYFVTQQTATADDLWSTRTTDWFETSDAIAVSAPATATLPSTAPGANQSTSFSVTTTCTNATGCSLNLAGTSDTVGLATVDHTDSVPRITPAAPSAPGAWASGSALGLGYTVLGSTNGKDTARWGTGTDFSNLALLNFIGATRTPTLLKDMTNTTETTVVGARLNAPLTTLPGSYSGTVQLVAVANP